MRGYTTVGFTWRAQERPSKGARAPKRGGSDTVKLPRQMSHRPECTHMANGVRQTAVKAMQSTKASSGIKRHSGRSGARSPPATAGDEAGARAHASKHTAGLPHGQATRLGARRSQCVTAVAPKRVPHPKPDRRRPASPRTARPRLAGAARVTQISLFPAAPGSCQRAALAAPAGRGPRPASLPPLRLGSGAAPGATRDGKRGDKRR